MRMDTTRGMTAAEWLAQAEERDLRHVISLYGEERFAGPIARAIVARRKTKPLETTRELADLVAGVVPRNRKDMGQHPATRTFQAVRIEVNHELDELKQRLTPLEASEARGASCRHHLPLARGPHRQALLRQAAHPERGLDPRLPLTNDMLPKPLFDNIERIKPSEAECEANPRARRRFSASACEPCRPWRRRTGHAAW